MAERANEPDERRGPGEVADAAGAPAAQSTDTPSESLDRDEATGSDAQTTRLEGLLSYVADASTDARPEGGGLPAGLRSAELVELGPTRTSVRLRGSAGAIEAVLAPEVEMAFLENARREGQRVLVEIEPGQTPVVVGVLQTRLPERVKLEGRVIEIDAKESLTLRSGRAGLRLRKDGDVELIGTRISAASRGLMRLVGRVLRLN
jgi:hypothetical protein